MALLLWWTMPVPAQEPRPGDAPAADIGAEGPLEVEPPASASPDGSDRTSTDSTMPNAGVRGALFVIDDILVEGARHGSAPIVVAETLLTVGRGYSEAELQQALHRVERLPFVVKAEFGLRKGSERGRFVLVVTISETWPVFGGADVTSFAGTGGDEKLSGFGTYPEVGARVFVRGYNELSAVFRGVGTFGIGGDPNRYGDVNKYKGGASFALTRHNLFSKRLVGSLNLEIGAAGQQTRPREGTTVGGKLTWALTRSSVLDAAFLASRHEDSETSWSERTATVGWRLDSTDDPFVPRRGQRFTLSLEHRDGHLASERVDPGAALRPSVGPPTEGDVADTTATASAAGFWALGSRLSLSGRAEVSARDNRLDGRFTVFDEPRTDGLFGPGAVQDGSSTYRLLRGTIAGGLLGTIRERPGSTTHLWWEAWASASFDRSDSTAETGDLRGGIRSHSSGGAIQLALAARGRWGTVRIRFSMVRDFESHWEPR